MTCFPDTLAKDISTSFQLNKAYAQVATKDMEGNVSVRTVHVHYFEDVHAFAFSTHMHSRKARDVSETKGVSGCYWDERNQIQYRWSAKAEFLSQNSHPEQKNLMTSLWKTMRDETRLAYVLDQLKIPYDTEPLPPEVSVEVRPQNHCMVRFFPYQWDVHHFSPKGYRFGKRTVYVKKNDTWEAQATRLIY